MMYELFLRPNWGFCFGTFYFWEKVIQSPNCLQNLPVEWWDLDQLSSSPNKLKNRPTSIRLDSIRPPTWSYCKNCVQPVNYGWWFRNPKANHRLDV